MIRSVEESEIHVLDTPKKGIVKTGITELVKNLILPTQPSRVPDFGREKQGLLYLAIGAASNNRNPSFVSRAGIFPCGNLDVNSGL